MTQVPAAEKKGAHGGNMVSPMSRIMGYGLQAYVAAA